MLHAMGMLNAKLSITTLLVGAGLAACGDNGGNNNPDASVDAPPSFAVNSCAKVGGTCMEIKSGDSATLQTMANTIGDNTSLVLDAGTYKMTNALTLRTKGAHIYGQGIDKTILDYGQADAQANGIDVIGDGFLVQDLTVLDAKKDGIRVENSNGVTYRRIKATWTTASSSSNGAYGIYPVKSQNVLVEDSEAQNASDAGLYVGQCQHVIVKGNHVKGNVAGLEIENTQYADVHDNIAEDNSGGIVVFDLPGNPIVGRDVRIYDNMILNNNHVNFASGGTVKQIPSGTGTFAMASRRVEITNNKYMNNNTVDISVISGLAIEPTATAWFLDTATLSGKWDDLGLLVPAAGKVANFRSENVVIKGNTHSGSGTMPDRNDPKMLGTLLGIHGLPVPNVLYDGIEETFDPDKMIYTNNHHICVGGNTGGTFADIGLALQADNPATPFYKPAAPFAPFDCTALTGPAIVPVVLP